MVRCIVTIIVSAGLIIIGSFFENWYINDTFTEMHEMLDEVSKKLENKTAVTDDILAVQKFWIDKKEGLHVYIPHTEIKEVELWISECVTYAKYKKFDEAEAKLEVVTELCEQIPKTFLIRIENLF